MKLDPKTKATVEAQGRTTATVNVAEIARLAATAPHTLGLTPTKPSKYRNRAFWLDGVYWKSEKEYGRWQELLLLARAGRITGLERQVTFPFVINGVKVCSYVADAVYVEDGVRVVEDTKSPVTRKNREYRIKAKLMFALYGVTIREV